MTAHDVTGSRPAHDPKSIPPGKPKYVNVDDTGVSMSWKTAVTIIFFVVGGLATAFTFLATLATKDDVSHHNVSEKAHEVILKDENGDKEPPKPLREVVIQHDAQIAEIQEMAEETHDAVVTVKNGFYEDRAERLADRAADRERNARRSREVWKKVKTKAMENQEKGRPAREGLDELVF